MLPDLKLPPEGKEFYTYEQYQQDSNLPEPPKTFAYTFFDAFKKSYNRWNPPSTRYGQKIGLYDICHMANDRDSDLRSDIMKALDKFLMENDGEISQWPVPLVGLQSSIQTSGRLVIGTEDPEIEEYSYTSSTYYVPFDFFGTEYDAPYGSKAKQVDGFLLAERKPPGHQFKDRYCYEETDEFNKADREENKLRRQIYPVWKWLLAKVALCISLLPGLFATVMCVVFIIWGITGKDPDAMSDNLITTYYSLLLRSGYVFLELVLFIGGWLLTWFLFCIFDADDIALSPSPTKAKAMYDAFYPEYERLREQEDIRRKAYTAFAHRWQETWYKTYVAQRSGRR